MCVNRNEPSVSCLQYYYTSSLALCKTLEYELADENGGIQKVRVEPATRSAAATCYTPGKIGKIVPRNVTPGRGKIVPRNVINYRI